MRSVPYPGERGKRIRIQRALEEGFETGDLRGAKRSSPSSSDGKLVFKEAKGSTRTLKAHELPILPPLRQSLRNISSWRCSGGPTAAGLSPHQEGEPGSARSLGSAAARGTKEQQKCPTFCGGVTRWDSQAQEALIINGSLK